jgi:hypothetical protein
MLDVWWCCTLIVLLVLRYDGTAGELLPECNNVR